ncbi:MAG: ribosome-binding factor A [Omnitrophica bacterium RIFCSPLOWO2_01_FULL_45_10]|nr:MAG: ribosome-binding factor A [Omnitrophica bacterium RIFCSPLOWO2_01_FULL_45_10]
MSTQRPGRVQEALRQEISRIVQNEVKDPRLGFITITNVEITRDLRYAKVYFSVLGESKDKRLTLKALNSAKGYMKNLISERIKLRFMPEIVFKIDESFADTKKITDILDNLKKEKRDD